MVTRCERDKGQFSKYTRPSFLEAHKQAACSESPFTFHIPRVFSIRHNNAVVIHLHIRELCHARRYIGGIFAHQSPSLSKAPSILCHFDQTRAITSPLDFEMELFVTPDPASRNKRVCRQFRSDFNKIVSLLLGV